MLNRSAPKGGYDFAAKAEYRRLVWSKFEAIRGRPVCFMPASEGLEIEEATQRRWPQELLYVVDKNPATVAVLKRRFPSINTHGLDVFEAIARWHKKGIQFGGIHLDMTTTVNTKFLDALAQLYETPNLFGRRGILVINVQRGRENEDIDAIKEAEWAQHEKEVGLTSWENVLRRRHYASGYYNENDCTRVNLIKNWGWRRALENTASKYNLDEMVIGTYLSHRVTMLYMIFEMTLMDFPTLKKRLEKRLRRQGFCLERSA